MFACAGPTGPGPQQVTFPPGERVVEGDGLSLELSGARYDMRQVSVQLTLRNQADAPITIEREGILLAYDALEYPISATASPKLQARTVIPAGEQAQLELGFVMEQALVEAGTLNLYSIRRGERLVEPLRVIVPPPAAFVEAAQPPPEP